VVFRKKGEQMTVYVVTRDVSNDPYGIDIRLIGVFTDKAEAEEVGGRITELELNKNYENRVEIYEPEPYDPVTHVCSIEGFYLGWYAE
jgi:hypothetical protein